MDSLTPSKSTPSKVASSSSKVTKPEPTPNEILLTAVVKQVEITSLDYKKLAEDLGLKPPAAKMRWYRWRDANLKKGKNDGEEGDAAVLAGGAAKSKTKGKASTGGTQRGKKRKLEENAEPAELERLVEDERVEDEGAEGEGDKLDD